jgi:hypothetical protein
VGYLLNLDDDKLRGLIWCKAHHDVRDPLFDVILSHELAVIELALQQLCGHTLAASRPDRRLERNSPQPARFTNQK